MDEKVRTAIWLYLFMFVAFFDLHAQYPILSPFAVSLGAAPSFIGLILGMYSITHLPGNLIAGYGVDRYGSKGFIVVSLILAGGLLLFQAHVTDPYQLLIVRSFSGFVLAFLSPACLALLAKLAKDHIQRGKLMAGNGLVHTLASVVSPAAGAYLVAKLGFSTSFSVLGWGLIITGVLAIFGIKESRKGSISTTGKTAKPAAEAHLSLHQKPPLEPLTEQSLPWLFFVLPLAISCSQGILFFELPMLHHHGGTQGILTSGILFSLVSIGALVTLSMLFLQRFTPLSRTMSGCLLLALVFFVLSIPTPVPLYVSLFLIGMAKGVIYPAIASLLAAATSMTRYGRAYSILSIAYSVGAFIGPVAAGQLRGAVSSYFIAFVILMIGLLFLPLKRLSIMSTAEPPTTA